MPSLQFSASQYIKLRNPSGRDRAARTGDGVLVSSEYDEALRDALVIRRFVSATTGSAGVELVDFWTEAVPEGSTFAGAVFTVTAFFAEKSHTISIRMAAVTAA